MTTPTAPIRYRSNRGRPRSRLERLLQFMWTWRAELMLTYIAAAVGISLFLQFVVLER